VRNVTLLASLKVEGSLRLEGDSEVSGGVEVLAGPGTVTEIHRAQVGGGLKLMGTDLGGGALLVGAGARVGAIEASGWEGIRISDCAVPGLKTKGCKGGIALRNALVGELDVDGGSGGIVLENTTVQSGLSVSECVNCTIVADANSEIHKGLHVEKSIGSIWMKGTGLSSGSFSVSGLDGSILLEDMVAQEADVSGVLGMVSLHNVTLGSSSTFEKNTGAFLAESCSFEELKMASPFHSIKLESNTFHSKGVSIKNAQGLVLLEHNRDLDLYLEENAYGVTLDGNSIGRATIAKNLGNTTLVENQFDVLLCSDNSRMQLLSNNITGPSVGQCAPAPATTLAPAPATTLPPVPAPTTSPTSTLAP